MANALTGGFNAVLQVRTEAINRILATLHQRGADKDASPSFLHSFATRIGDPPEMSGGEWAIAPAVFQIVAGLTQGKKSPPKPSKEPHAISNSPSGIAEAWRLAVEALTKLPFFIISGRPTRGTARVQLSTPTIAVAGNSISTVTTHVSVRARYTPDGGTAILPEPIHGELQAAFSVETTPRSSSSPLREH